MFVVVCVSLCVLQTQLELESVKIGVASSEEPVEVGSSSELQSTLQLVTELKAQLQSVREEMSERRHQA